MCSQMLKLLLHRWGCKVGEGGRVADGSSNLRCCGLGQDLAKSTRLSIGSSSAPNGNETQQLRVKAWFLRLSLCLTLVMSF